MNKKKLTLETAACTQRSISTLHRLPGNHMALLSSKMVTDSG